MSAIGDGLRTQGPRSPDRLVWTDSHPHAERNPPSSLPTPEDEAPFAVSFDFSSHGFALSIGLGTAEPAGKWR